jgi:hypothetical protein
MEHGTDNFPANLDKLLTHESSNILALPFKEQNQ